MCVCVCVRERKEAKEKKEIEKKRRERKERKKVFFPSELTDRVAALEAPAPGRARDRRLEALAVFLEAVRLAAVAPFRVRGGPSPDAAGGARGCRASAGRYRPGPGPGSSPSEEEEARVRRRARGRGDDGPPVVERRDHLQAYAPRPGNEERRRAAAAAAAAGPSPADGRERRRGRGPRLRDLGPEGARVAVEDGLYCALPEFLVGLVVLALGTLARELWIIFCFFLMGRQKRKNEGGMSDEREREREREKREKLERGTETLKKNLTSQYFPLAKHSQ